MQPRFRILHIEDEPAQANLVEAIFRTHAPSFECENVNHLEAAIERLQQPGHKFKGVILDLGLPGGFRGVAAIRRLVESVEPIPIVVHTGAWDEDIEDAAFELGVQSFIYKDCDNKEFVRKVKRAFTRYYATQAWRDRCQKPVVTTKFLTKKEKVAIISAAAVAAITGLIATFWEVIKSLFVKH